MSQLEKRFRLFFLGAGFSRPAGLPLADELWSEVLSLGLASQGASTLTEDIESYLEFRGLSRATEPDSIDFEDFLAFLDIEHFLGLQGGEAWTLQGNPSQLLIRRLIANIIVQRTPSHDEVPDLYLEFASRLRPSDYVFTFNYDVLLERALDRVGMPYRLFTNRYEEVNGYSATIDSTREEVVILKLHGSVDWFDSSDWDETTAMRARSGLAPRPHPIFTNRTTLGVKPLLEGPREEGDSLSSMHRVTHIDQLSIRAHSPMGVTPWLLGPSTAKVVYATRLRDSWWGLGNAGGMNLGLGIVGFSMPEHDDYACQAVYRVASNYLGVYWDTELLGMKKPAVAVVDKRETLMEVDGLKSRYRFLDPERTVFHLSGFEPEALPVLFPDL